MKQNTKKQLTTVHKHTVLGCLSSVSAMASLPVSKSEHLLCPQLCLLIPNCASLNLALGLLASAFSFTSQGNGGICALFMNELHPRSNVITLKQGPPKCVCRAVGRLKCFCSLLRELQYWQPKGFSSLFMSGRSSKGHYSPQALEEAE